MSGRGVADVVPYRSLAMRICVAHNTSIPRSVCECGEISGIPPCLSGQVPAIEVPGPTPKRPGRVLVDEGDLSEYLERWKNGTGE